jgi:glycosyltransferase involved in cell wall biosynthesis
VRIAMIAFTLYQLDSRVQRAAEALAEDGHEVDVFSVSRGAPAAGNSHERLRFRFLSMQKKQTGLARYVFEYGVFSAWAFAAVSLLHPRRRYQVVYVHNMPNFLVFAGLLPKLSGARIVLDVHDPAAELLADIRGAELPAWTRWLAEAEERISIAFSDTLITVNESMRRRLSAITARPVSVVMNIPDPERFASVGEPRGQRNMDLIVYSGSVAYRNGVDLIVRAAYMLAGEFPALRFRIIGEGPALDDVMNLAADLGVTDRIEFRGMVPSGQVPEMLSDANAGIAPQRGGVFGSLVFSMKVADYVSLGLPVICSGIATMRHYFTDDELLFFAPGSPEDLARAIRAVLADPAAAGERAIRSRAKLDKLDWNAQKQTLVTAIASLAHRGGQHPWRLVPQAGSWSARATGRPAQGRQEETTRHV